jgi:phosphate transport system substrate-binding protein
MKAILRAFAGIAALVSIAAQSAAFAEPIRGAGSTFAAPVIAKWSQTYRVVRADGGDYIPHDSGVDYEPVGSSAGMFRLDQPEMDFAVTDVPQPADQLRSRGRLQFPIVIGGVVPIVNLQGIGAGALKLTGALLADIYLGKIVRWDDPQLAGVNPGLRLPAIPITVVRRADGSGSTFAFSLYLSEVSAEWKSRLGADTTLAWPVGVAAEGTQGVARRVQEVRGAVGYVEFGVVARANLSFALIENKAGRFVRPDPTSFQAAAASANWRADNEFHQLITNAPGDGAYPIAATAFAVVDRSGRSTLRVRRTLEFFGVALERGRQEALALGYVPLPESVVARIKAHWDERLGGRP